MPVTDKRRDISGRGATVTSGFTLLEVIIVMAIMAMLAALVIPLFSSSTDEGKEVALTAVLAQMRNAVTLYYHQHQKTYPGVKPSLGALDGTGAAETVAAFVEQLAMYSDAGGVVKRVKDSTFRFGPYLPGATLPVNPLDGSNTLQFLKAGDPGAGNLASTGDGSGGWWFDSVTGKFVANVPGYLTW